MVFASSKLIDGFGWLIILGGLTYTAFEVMVKNNRFYRAGVDDALIIIALLQVLIGFGTLIERSDNYYVLFYGFALIICTYLALRCTDMLMTAAAGISLLAFIFFSWIKITPYGLATAPFVMMLASGSVYWLACKYDKQKTFINYHNCFIVLQVVGLAALYAAGNYFVIQNLSTNMMHRTGPVPFGGIFWAWTILLPFTYIAWGIYKKDVITLRIGMLLVAAAVATFRAYYHVLPVDVALTLAGALLSGIVYGVTKYLKMPKHGFTITQAESLNLMDQLKVESLIVAETFAHAPASATDGIKYGGGSFGGGGSSGGF